MNKGLGTQCYIIEYMRKEFGIGEALTYAVQMELREDKGNHSVYMIGGVEWTVQNQGHIHCGNISRERARMDMQILMGSVYDVVNSNCHMAQERLRIALAVKHKELLSRVIEITEWIVAANTVLAEYRGTIDVRIIAGAKQAVANYKKNIEVLKSFL